MNVDALRKKLVAAGLPALGGALAGPAGAAVGSTIAATLGVDPEPDAIARAIVHDPEAMIALRRLDADMERERLEHERGLAAMQVADVQHARGIDRDDRMRRALAPAFIVMPLAVLGLLFWVQPSGELLGAGTLVLGLAIANAKDVSAFFFGTSIGSAKKSAEIAQMTAGGGKG